MREINVQRPTWAEINLDRLAYNFHSSKRFIGLNLKYMAVVKADGYGHNAAACARRLELEGADWLGVALPEEGISLRESGIKLPILCLGGFWNQQHNLLLQYDLTPAIYQTTQAVHLNKAARDRNAVAKIHIKIDTGMGRIGVRFDEVQDFVKTIKNCKNLQVEALMTHFAAADDPGENEFTDLQIKRFNECVAIFENNGIYPIFSDLANSPGAVVHPNSRADMVRLGGILYGLGGDVLPKAAEKPELKPVMSVYSRITHLKTVPPGETIGYSRTFRTRKQSLIATVPFGYADGLPRVLSNTGRVIINGRFAPIVGRISMDWTIVDVTGIPDVKLQDKVTIIGADNGLVISAEDLARQSRTISYEITCGINQRVPKVYVGSK